MWLKFCNRILRLLQHTDLYLEQLFRLCVGLPVLHGQGILFSISAIWLINSTPRAIDYFNSWWCVIEQLHATRHPLDYILVMRACPYLFQRSTLRKLPNSSYRDQIFMHRRSIDLSSHMFARIARGVTGNRQHSQIKSNVFIGMHDLHHST